MNACPPTGGMDDLQWAPATLVQKTEQPQWNLILVSDFDVILEYERMFEIPDLPGIFVFSSNFKDKLMIYQEICLLMQIHLVVY